MKNKPTLASIHRFNPITCHTAVLEQEQILK